MHASGDIGVCSSDWDEIVRKCSVWDGAVQVILVSEHQHELALFSPIVQCAIGHPASDCKQHSESTARIAHA